MKYKKIAIPYGWCGGSGSGWMEAKRECAPREGWLGRSKNEGGGVRENGLKAS